MKKAIKEALNSLWIVTLVSTMVGVYAGIYLNGYFDKKALKRDKQEAFKEVILEINENHQTLKDYNAVMNVKFNEMKYIFGKLNEESEIVITPDSLDAFITRTDSAFTLESTERVLGGLKLNGDVNININSPLVARGLSSIVWDAFKQTNFLTQTSFRCLTDIETIYNLQEEVNEANAGWRNAFYSGDFYDKKEKRDAYMKDWSQLLLRQQMLLIFYDTKENVFDNCDD